jgi:hypothetical protein
LQKSWCCNATSVGDIPILVADQEVVGETIRVEIHPHLGIQSDDLQGGGQVIHEEFLGFIKIIDVGVAAIEFAQGDCRLQVAGELGTSFLIDNGLTS